MMSESKNNRLEQRKKAADERLSSAQAKAEGDRILLEKIDRCVAALESWNFEAGILPSEPNMKATLNENEQARVRAKLMTLIDQL